MKDLCPVILPPFHAMLVITTIRYVPVSFGVVFVGDPGLVLGHVAVVVVGRGGPAGDAGDLVLRV